MNLDTLLENLVEFSNISSVVGFEDQFVEYLESKFKQIGYDTEISSEGLLVVKSLDPNYSNHYTSSHIDRTGLVVSDGKLTYAVHNLKDQLGIKANSTESACKKIGERFVDKQVKINDEDYSISSYEIKRNSEGLNRLEFILDSDMDLSELDNIAVPYSDPISYDQEMITGQIDNVINTAILYTMMAKGEVKGNVIFSVKEEIGLSGSLISNYLSRQGIESTNDLLVLDTTPFSDQDYIMDEISLRNRDTRGLYSKERVELLESICQDMDVDYRFKDKVLEDNGSIKSRDDGSVIGYGFTELGKIVEESLGKYNGTTLQLPNLGDGVEEKVSIKGLENYIKVLREYYNRI